MSEHNTTKHDSYVMQRAPCSVRTAVTTAPPTRSGASEKDVPIAVMTVRDGRGLEGDLAHAVKLVLELVLLTTLSQKPCVCVCVCVYVCVCLRAPCHSTVPCSRSISAMARALCASVGSPASAQALASVTRTVQALLSTSLLSIWAMTWRGTREN